jgi:hypothetical protein
MGLDIDFCKVKQKRKELSYFRKVNFLVKFFNDKIIEWGSGPIVDGLDIPITKEWCEELLEKCNKVVDKYNELKASYTLNTNGDNTNLFESKEANDLFAKFASETLPTMAGFFYGSTDYDEWYLDDVKDVIEHLKNNIISEFDKLDDDEYIVFNADW